MVIRVITSKAQLVSEVLDGTYVPPTMDETLFEHKQTYMFAVFKRKLLTLKAKNIITKYESTGDAQSLFRELETAYKEGVEQDQIVSILRKKWRDFTCDDRWNRPFSVFLETWASHLRSYEDASGLIVSDDDQILTLKKAILPNTALHSITTNSTVIQAALVAHELPKKSMSYSIFMKLSKTTQNH